eukprot:2105751-Pyramimonas_sp.AAC.1
MQIKARHLTETPNGRANGAVWATGVRHLPDLAETPAGPPEMTRAPEKPKRDLTQPALSTTKRATGPKRS